MLKVLSYIDDVSSDLRFEWDLSYWIVTCLFIFDKAEFLERAILEKYTNAELTLVFSLVSEHINDLFPHVVDESLPRVHMLKIIIVPFFIFKMIVAPPGFSLSVIVRQDIAVDYKHKALV